jgi:hypothetical protein
MNDPCGTDDRLDGSTRYGAGRRRGVAVAVLVVILGIGAGAVAWPSLQGRMPVLVVAVAARVEGQAEAMGPGVRELGWELELVSVPGGWCGLGDVDPETVDVVVMDPDPLCRDVAAANVELVLVAPSATMIEAPSSWTVIDVSWILGDGGILRMPCEVRENCEIDGQVTVRSEPGFLSELGWARVGRVLAVAS